MFGTVLKNLKYSPPMGWSLLSLSALLGVIAGALRLSESTDAATAAGLAVYFSVAMGAWAGLEISIFVLRMLTAWFASCNELASEWARRLGCPSTLSQPPSALRRFVVWTLIMMVPLGAVSCCFSVIALVIDLGVPGVGVPQAVRLLTLGIGFGLAFVGISGLALPLVQLKRNIAAAERLLDPERLQSNSIGHLGQTSANAYSWLIAFAGRAPS